MKNQQAFDSQIIRQIDLQLLNNELKIENLQLYLQNKRNQVTELQRCLIQQLQSIQQQKQQNSLIRSQLTNLKSYITATSSIITSIKNNLINNFDNILLNFSQVINKVYQHASFIIQTKNDLIVDLSRQIQQLKNKNHYSNEYFLSKNKSTTRSSLSFSYKKQQIRTLNQLSDNQIPQPNKFILKNMSKYFKSNAHQLKNDKMKQMGRKQLIREKIQKIKNKADNCKKQVFWKK